MKRSTRSTAAASSKRRKPIATRPSRGTIQKGGASAPSSKSSRKSRAGSRPTYFSLLKDVEHALKHEHRLDGASVRKLKRHLERKYGGRPFDGETCKMLRSAVNRLHKKGRIKKHPKRMHVYKFKPPIVPAHHIFGTPAQRRAGRRAAAASKRSRANRSSRPTQRRR